MSSIIQLPKISVIVPVFRDEAGAEHCLVALKQQVYPGEVQVIIVDNGPEFSLRRLAAACPDVTFLSEPRPGSYNARNAGLRAAQGEILAFTDADCRPEPYWLANGAASLLADPAIGSVGGKVNVRPAISGRPSLPELYDMLTAFQQKKYVEQNNFAVTANMFTRRTVIDRVGDFNGALKSGGDYEFGQRVAAAGLKLRYAGDAVVDHPARDSYAELFKKTRRVIGGERDRKPDWASCIRCCVRHLLPPMGPLRSIFAAREAPVRSWDRVRLTALALIIQWAHAVERLRLQVTGAQSARV
jgi:GT2 family glycosyltransferase